MRICEGGTPWPVRTWYAWCRVRACVIEREREKKGRKRVSDRQTNRCKTPPRQSLLLPQNPIPHAECMFFVAELHQVLEGKRESEVFGFSIGGRERRERGGKRRRRERKQRERQTKKRWSLFPPLARRKRGNNKQSNERTHRPEVNQDRAELRRDCGGMLIRRRGAGERG